MRILAVCIIILGSFIGCDGDETIKSGLGESCRVTADCEEGLRCVELTCVNPEDITDGDTAEQDRLEEEDPLADGDAAEDDGDQDAAEELEPAEEADMDPDPENPETDGDVSEQPEGDAAEEDAEEGGVDIILPDGDMDDPGEQEDARRLCSSDSDCSPIADYYCELSTHQCKRRLGLCEACSDHAQCGFDNDHCISDPNTGETVCGRACYDDDDCLVYGSAFKCTEGQCTLDPTVVGEGTCCIDAHCENVPDKPVCNFLTHRCYPGCHDDLECPTNQVCDEGHCRDGCESSRDCAAGFACDPATRHCVEGDCFDTFECPLETLCDTETHRCVPGCEDDPDCLPHNECLEIEGEKQCVERSGCRNTEECDIGYRCNPDAPDAVHPERGTCQPGEGSYTCCGCEEDADCGDSGYCVEWTFGCEADSDCNDPEFPRCLGGKCTYQGILMDDRADYKACVWETDCKRLDGQGNATGTLDCPNGFTCGRLVISGPETVRETGVCVMDCHAYCAVPEHPDQCGDFNTSEVCGSLTAE